MNTPTEKPRRWFRYSLRTAFVLLTVACVWLAVVHRAQKQQRAVAAIEQFGARVFYDYEWADYRYGQEKEPRGPTWLRTLLGRDYFDTVVAVMFNLQQGQDIPDKALEPVAKLPSLVSVGGVKGGPRISESGLTHLKGLTDMEHLAFQLEKIGDSGLAEIEGLTHLENLWLSHSRITDDGLKYIRRMTRLRHLILIDCEITDAGPESVSGLTELELLNLSGTRVTDAGLKHLKGLARLKHLGVKNTKVTSEGLRELQKALPSAQIF